MRKLGNTILEFKTSIIFGIILAVAILTRLLFLESIPAGMNQDEAFVAYEAFSLLTTGTDTGGNSFSIYLPTWGTGTSVLYTYISVLFFWLFGISSFVARLPQALFGILSCYLFFCSLTLMYNKRIGYIAFFLSAIMPWHIMMSRWGIEVNLAPFFILAGFYFFLKSYQKLFYLLISAFFYGLGIYAYDCCAIYIVFSFAFQLFYRLWSEFNKKTFLYILSSGFLFSLIISPFLLLIAVNNDLIPEIKSFITIPKMHFWRQGNVSFSDFIPKLENLWRIFYTGNDGLLYNSLNEYGIFYPISLPFAIVGLYAIMRNACVKSENRKNNIIMLGTLIIGILYSGLIYANVNRLNFLWFNIIILIAVGIDYLFRKKRDLIFIIGLYSCFFISFCWFYYTYYNTISRQHFSSDVEKSLSIALDGRKTDKYPIYVVAPTEVYPKILFWDRVPPQEFRKTVQWYDPNAAFLHAKSFSFYYINPDLRREDVIYDAIYIAPREKRDYFANTFKMTETGEYIVAFPKRHIKAEHPVWREDLVFLSNDRIIRPSVDDKARVIRFNDDELWVRWNETNEEHFIKNKETGVYQFQK